MRQLTFDQAWIRDGRKLCRGRAQRDISSSDEDYPAYHTYLKRDSHGNGQGPAHRLRLGDEDVNPPRRASSRAVTKGLASHAKEKVNLVTFAKQRQSAVDVMLVNISPRGVLSAAKSGRSSSSLSSTAAAAASTFSSARHAASSWSSSSDDDADDSNSDRASSFRKDARHDGSWVPASAAVGSSASTRANGACPRARALRCEDESLGTCTCGACSSRTERLIADAATTAATGAPDASETRGRGRVASTATTSAEDDSCRQLLRALLTQIEQTNGRSAADGAVISAASGPRGSSGSSGSHQLMRSLLAAAGGVRAAPQREVSFRAGRNEEEEIPVEPATPRVAWYSYLPSGKAAGGSTGARSGRGSNLRGSGGLNGTAATSGTSRVAAAAAAAPPGTVRSRSAANAAESAVVAARQRPRRSSSGGSSSESSRSSSASAGRGRVRAGTGDGDNLFISGRTGVGAVSAGAGSAVRGRVPSTRDAKAAGFGEDRRQVAAPHFSPHGSALQRYSCSTSTEETDDSDVAEEEAVAQMLGSHYPHNARMGTAAAAAALELAELRRSARQRARTAVLGGGGEGGGDIAWDPRRSVLAAADGIDPGASFTSWVTGNNAVRQGATPRARAGLKARFGEGSKSTAVAAAGAAGGATLSPTSWAAVPTLSLSSRASLRRYSMPGNVDGGASRLAGGLWREAAALVQGDTARHRSRSLAGERLTSALSDGSEDSFAYRMAAAVTTSRGAGRTSARPLSPSDSTSSSTSTTPQGRTKEAAEPELSPLRNRIASSRLSPTASKIVRSPSPKAGAGVGGPPSRSTSVISGSTADGRNSSGSSSTTPRNWFLTDVLRTPVGSHVGECTTRGSGSRGGGAGAGGGYSPGNGLSSPWTGSHWAQSPSQKLSLSRVWGPAKPRASDDGALDKSPASTRSPLSMSPPSALSDDALWRSPQQPLSPPPPRPAALAATSPRQSGAPKAKPSAATTAAAQPAVRRASLGVEFTMDMERSPPRRYSSAVAALAPRSSGSTSRRVLSF